MIEVAGLEFQFDLTPYYGLIMSFVLLMPPILAGTVVGFLLLDQRDDQTATALQVTPLSTTGYLAYRMTVPTALSLVITCAVLPLAGLVQVGFVTLLLSALSAAFLAPFYALLVAALAANKVQGFAVTKALGVLLVPPTLAYFVAPPWHWASGIIEATAPVFGAVAAPLGNIDKVVVIENGNGQGSGGINKFASTAPQVIFGLLQQLEALGLNVPSILSQLGIRQSAAPVPTVEVVPAPVKEPLDS